MTFDIACPCGSVVPVTAGMAGSTTTCECGLVLAVPRLSQLRSRPMAEAVPIELNPAPADGPRPPRPEPVDVVIPPTPVRLSRPETDSVEALAMLAGGAVWVQEIWQVHCIPLLGLEIGTPGGAAVTLGSLTLTFDTPGRLRQWCAAIETHRAEPVPIAGHVAEGVALVRNPPDAAFEDLGRVEAAGPTWRTAVRAMQLRAA